MHSAGVHVRFVRTVGPHVTCAQARELVRGIVAAEDGRAFADDVDVGIYSSAENFSLRLPGTVKSARCPRCNADCAAMCHRCNGTRKIVDNREYTPVTALTIGGKALPAVVRSLTDPALDEYTRTLNMLDMCSIYSPVDVPTPGYVQPAGEGCWHRNEAETLQQRVAAVFGEGPVTTAGQALDAAWKRVEPSRGEVLWPADAARRTFARRARMQNFSGHHGDFIARQLRKSARIVELAQVVVRSTAPQYATVRVGRVVMRQSRSGRRVYDFRITGGGERGAGCLYCLFEKRLHRHQAGGALKVRVTPPSARGGGGFTLSCWSDGCKGKTRVRPWRFPDDSVLVQNMFPHASANFVLEGDGGARDQRLARGSRRHRQLVPRHPLWTSHRDAQERAKKALIQKVQMWQAATDGGVDTSDEILKSTTVKSRGGGRRPARRAGGGLSRRGPRAAPAPLPVAVGPQRRCTGNCSSSSSSCSCGAGPPLDALPAAPRRGTGFSGRSRPARRSRGAPGRVQRPGATRGSVFVDDAAVASGGSDDEPDDRDPGSAVGSHGYTADGGFVVDSEDEASSSGESSRGGSATGRPIAARPPPAKRRRLRKTGGDISSSDSDCD